MSSEILVRLKCDHFDIKDCQAVTCTETILVSQCETFVDHNVYTGAPFSALEYLVPEGWLRESGVSHFCPTHAESKRKQKYSLPNFEEPVRFENEEPTRKIKLRFRDNE